MPTRLLLADDEPLVLENLLTMMPWEEMGCTIVGTAEDGEEALDTVKTQEIDLVISDIRMPGMDGLELFRSVQELNNPPLLIALTGYDEFEYAQRALRLGIFDYILKPIDYGYLRRAVEKAIDQRSVEKTGANEPVIADLRALLGGQKPPNDERLPWAAYSILLTRSEELLTRFEEGRMGAFLREAKENVSELMYLSLEPEFSLFLLCCDDAHLKADARLGVAEKLSAHLRLTAPLVPSRLLSDAAELSSAYDATRNELDHLHREGGSWLQTWNRDERHALVAQRVGKLIEQEYQRDLVVREVAEALGVSVSYLSESVRQVFDATFVELLTSVRLEHARKALLQTEASVAQIAAMVGYRDYRYFARVFRERSGLTPSDYRSRRQGW